MVLMVLSLQLGRKIEQRAGLEKATLVPKTLVPRPARQRYREPRGLFRTERMIFFTRPHAVRRITRWSTPVSQHSIGSQKNIREDYP